MKFELVIKADFNDADYVTSTNVVEKETIEALYPLVEALKAKRGDWPDMEGVRDTDPAKSYPNINPELIEMFRDLCPRGEYGIHTIESIIYYPVPEKVRLL